MKLCGVFDGAALVIDQRHAADSALPPRRPKRHNPVGTQPLDSGHTPAEQVADLIAFPGQVCIAHALGLTQAAEQPHASPALLVIRTRQDGSAARQPRHCPREHVPCGLSEDRAHSTVR